MGARPVHRDDDQTGGVRAENYLAPTAADADHQPSDRTAAAVLTPPAPALGLWGVGWDATRRNLVLMDDVPANRLDHFLSCHWYSSYRRRDREKNKGLTKSTIFLTTTHYSKNNLAYHTTPPFVNPKTAENRLFLPYFSQI